jgi:sulfate permease, SulP family
VHYVILRVKRIRNPDVVCMEKLEQFLKAAQFRGIIVLIAGARQDLLDACRRLRFSEWFPADRIFPQTGDEDSVTIAAVRSVYERLGDKNACPHCVPRKQSGEIREKLYYLV